METISEQDKMVVSRATAAELANKRAKLEAEVKAHIELEMVAFCTEKGIVKGWSVAQHAAFMQRLVVELLESDVEGEIGAPGDTTKFSLYVVFRTLANYSQWRQAHEGEGKPLQAGTGRGQKSLAGEYDGV